MIGIKVDAREALHDLHPDREREALEHWLPRAALWTRMRLQENILARTQTVGRTGNLRKKISAEFGNEGFSLWMRTDYASFVDQPTRPHEIKARNKQFLAFPAQGGIITRRRATGHVRTRFVSPTGKSTYGAAVFTRRVMHPGTRGAFFVDATMQDANEHLPRLLEESIAFVRRQ